MAEWVRTYEHGPEWVESLGGVTWGTGKLPGWLHRCKAQTRGWMGSGYVERCNCGAIRLATDDPWMQRNQTRIARRRKRRDDRKPRVPVTCRECGKSYECAKGSRRAREEQCDHCWGERLVAEQGRP